MDFIKRIKELRKQKGFSQQSVADGINISLRQYQRYETEEQKPSFGILIVLADFYDVSIDYLVGRTDNPKINK